MKKLENGCAVVLFKSLSSPFDAVIEVIWFLVDEEVDNSLGSGKWLIAWQLFSLGGKVGGIRQVLFGRASLSGEQSFEVISRPLNSIKRSLSKLIFTWRQCSIAFGKFFSVQIGMDFSGGSRDEPYDSVTFGITI